MSEADQRSRRCDDQSRLLESNKRNEKSNSGSDRVLERARNRLEDPLANAKRAEPEEQHARGEYRGQRRAPTDRGPRHRPACNREEEEILTHGARQGDWIIRQQSHQHRGCCGRNAGSDHHRAKVHSGAGQHPRLDENHVSHRKKGDDAAAQLGTRRGPVLA